MTNETKRWFFKKVNKIDKPLASLTEKKREDTNKSETKEVTMNTTEIQSIVRDYHE